MESKKTTYMIRIDREVMRSDSVVKQIVINLSIIAINYSIYYSIIKFSLNRKLNDDYNY